MLISRRYNQFSALKKIFIWDNIRTIILFAFRATILNQAVIHLQGSSNTETTKQMYSEVQMLQFVYKGNTISQYDTMKAKVSLLSLLSLNLKKNETTKTLPGVFPCRTAIFST